MYTDDPKKNPSAKRYDRLTFDEAIERKLGVMDMQAIALCRENNIRCWCFDFKTCGNIRRAITEGTREVPAVGTLVTN